MGQRVVLETLFVGKDQGTAATMNEIGGVATNTGRRLEQMGRQGASSVSMMSKEWDRFKRHFSYATAGFATYEIFNAIGRLRDYQNEIANLNATLQTTPQELQNYSKAAFDISTRTGTALDDVFQSMQNIINSFPQMSEAMRSTFIPATAMIEAMGARVSQIAPQQFGATISGLADAFFGRAEISRQGPSLIDRIAREVIQVQKRIPNPQSGQQFIASMPMLAQGAVTAGFSLEQALALYTVAQRQLINPRTTSQYLRQLFTRLHTPTRASQPFFAQAGIGTEELSTLSGPELLRRLMIYGLTLPGGMRQDTSSTQDEVTKFLQHPSWRRTGVTGQAMQFFRQSIGGRIQSGVAMASLLQNLGQIPIEQKSIANAPSLESRFKDMDLSMSQLGQGFTNITTEIGTTFLPALGGLSRGVTGLEGVVNRVTTDANQVRNWLNQHTKGVPIVGGHVGGMAEIAALAAGGAGVVGLKRFLGSERGLSILRRVPGIGRLLGRAGGASELASAILAPERAAAMTMAAGNALAGVAHGTYDAPFWVVIHPLSKTQVPELFGNHPSNKNGLASTAENDIKNFAKGAGGGAGGLFGLRKLIQRVGARGASEIKFGAGWMESESSLAARLGLVGVDAGLALGGGALAFGGMRTGSAIKIPGPGGYALRNTGNSRFQIVGKNHTLAANFLRALGSHQIPKGLESYFSDYASGKITAEKLNQAITNYSVQALKATNRGGTPTGLQTAIMGMFRLGPGHQLHLSHVDKKHAAQGYVEATLTLEPTQEFKNLLRPQQVKVHIPVSDLPAPKSRGQTRVPRRGR